MNKISYLAILALGISPFAYADAYPYGLNNAEVMAYLVNVQNINGYQYLCTYRAATKQYGVHEVQASIAKGCNERLAYIAPSASGGILRVLGTTSSVIVKRMNYRPAPTPTQQRYPAATQRSPVVNRSPRNPCDDPNVLESYNPSTGKMTYCKGNRAR